MFRIKGLSWWERELPTEDEMSFGKETLKTNNNEVDFIISHCCPQQIAAIFSHGNLKLSEVDTAEILNLFVASMGLTQNRRIL